MNKIDKRFSLSQAYRDWYLENPTRPYRSSDDPYHDDVLSELLIVQDGLCAYTEFRLVDRAVLEEYRKGFVNGRQSLKLKNKHMTQIEHFDPLEKKERGWNWENLFAVCGPVNEAKGSKSIHAMMKPDQNDYNPEKLLAYDSVLHLFYPNESLSNPEQSIVAQMILVLGLNDPTILIHRRKELTQAINRQNWFGEPVTVDQFLTAYAFLNRKSA